MSNKPQPKGLYFRGQRAPSIDFDDVRDGTRAQASFIDVDLSTARSLAAGTGLLLPISGNAFYIDQKNDSGYASVIFQEQVSMRPTAVTVYPGFVARVPFTQVTIVNDAQPGETLRIIFGTDIDFVPSAAAGVSILNAVDVNDIVGPNTQYFNRNATVTFGAMTATPIVLPAANTRGIAVRGVFATAIAGAGGSTSVAIVAGLVAPTALTTAPNRAVLIYVSTNTTTGVSNGLFNFSRKLPAGWGLWACDVAATVNGGCEQDVSYEIL